MGIYPSANYAILLESAERLFIVILKAKRIFCGDISIKYSKNGRMKQTKKKTDRYMNCWVSFIYLLKDVIIGICGPKPEHSRQEAYARAYVAYALYGWVEVWFQRGMRETAEEIRVMFKGQGL